MTENFLQEVSPASLVSPFTCDFFRTGGHGGQKRHSF
jgi:hypothetical protein